MNTAQRKQRKEELLADLQEKINSDNTICENSCAEFLHFTGCPNDGLRQRTKQFIRTGKLK